MSSSNKDVLLKANAAVTRAGLAIRRLDIATARSALTSATAAAHQAHDAFLKQSMDNALEHIPRLLRGTVKKILGL